MVLTAGIDEQPCLMHFGSRAAAWKQRKFYEQALQAGISIAPGPIFSAKGKYRNCIRLNAAFWSAKIERAIEQLGRLATRISGSLREDTCLSLRKAASQGHHSRVAVIRHTRGQSAIHELRRGAGAVRDDGPNMPMRPAMTQNSLGTPANSHDR